MTKREKLLCLLAIAGIALLTLIPFFKVGFTNGDDLEYFITSHQSLRGWLSDATIYAQNAGRFYFLITKYFYYIPYLADNFAVTKTIQYGSLLACYVYAAYIVWRLFKSQSLSLIVLLVLIANTHLHPNNHVPTYLSVLLYAEPRHIPKRHSVEYSHRLRYSFSPTYSTKTIWYSRSYSVRP